MGDLLFLLLDFALILGWDSESCLPSRFFHRSFTFILVFLLITLLGLVNRYSTLACLCDFLRLSSCSLYLRVRNLIGINKDHLER